MTIVAELMSKPGVLAAGEYAFRGDRFSCEGDLPEEQARLLSIICRSTTMGIKMEGHMLAQSSPQNGIDPAQGWALRGPDHTLCVLSNVFCLLDHGKGSVNGVLGYMRDALRRESKNLF